MVFFLGSSAGKGLLGIVLLLLGSCATPPEVSDSAEPLVSDVALLTPTEAEASPAPPAPGPETTLEPSQPIGDVLLTCRTAEDKLIELYDMGSTIQYMFGPEGQPELVLEVPRDQASTYQWQGIGRYENYSVSVPNKDTVYSVFWSRDRLTIDQPPDAGVDVEINGEYVATVDCATDTTHNLIGVELPPTPL